MSQSTSQVSVFVRGRKASRSGRTRAFTITEMLVVIGIVVLVAALAVPAINVLSGSRSIDGASNVISGMISRARAESLARQEPIGLAIFQDPLRDRVGLALVAGPQPWKDGVAYQRGDFVSYLVTPAPGQPPKVWYFLCNTTHTSSALAAATERERPPQYPDVTSDAWTPVQTASASSDPDAIYSGATPPRRYTTTSYVSMLPETDITYLPPGVGAQVLNSSQQGLPLRAAQSDRYLASSVIFFNGDGKLAVNRRFGVMYNTNDNTPTSAGAPIFSSRLGLAIRFNGDNAVAARSTNIDPNDQRYIDPTMQQPTQVATGSITTSGLGVLLFDRQQYLAQNPPKWDPQLVEQDYTRDSASEDWLDGHGTLLLINRFNGTLLKTE